jgi:uncharacterized repeat protein (TIGR03847 family)
VAEHIDFDPADSVGVGTVGSPGQRQFFLRASAGGTSVVLNCEKFHVQGLVSRIQQLLTDQGIELGTPDPRPPGPASPGEASWIIGELGLGYHEAKGRFVIVAREAPTSAPEGEGEGEPEGQREAEPTQPTEEDLASARFWLGPEQMRTFLAQAEAVLSSGRPTCPYCGLPMDPGGHPCPAANGSRPVF